MGSRCRGWSAAGSPSRSRPPPRGPSSPAPAAAAAAWPCARRRRTSRRPGRTWRTRPGNVRSCLQRKRPLKLCVETGVQFPGVSPLSAAAAVAAAAVRLGCATVRCGGGGGCTGIADENLLLRGVQPAPARQCWSEKRRCTGARKAVYWGEKRQCSGPRKALFQSEKACLFVAALRSHRPPRTMTDVGPVASTSTLKKKEKDPRFPHESPRIERMRSEIAGLMGDRGVFFSPHRPQRVRAVPGIVGVLCGGGRRQLIMDQEERGPHRDRLLCLRAVSSVSRGSRRPRSNYMDYPPTRWS